MPALRPLFLALGLSAARLALAADAPVPDDCHDPAPWRVLAPAADTPPAARAAWLDGQRLLWPAAAPAAGERVVLLHAATEGLRTAPGQPPQGVTQAWTLAPDDGPWPPADPARWRHFGADAPRWALPPEARAALPQALRGELRLARLDAQGRVLDSAALQTAGALDALYAPAEALDDYGAHPPLQRDDASGSWTLQRPGDARGLYYRYLVDVRVPGVGLVRQRVADPYSVSSGADARRSYVSGLDEPAVTPPGWATDRAPDTVRHATDLTVYELHVRDFSRDDPSVPAAQRGRYAAFTQAGSAGMRHLRALARAGLTDVHLLPIFDLATVPERGCLQPRVPQAAPDSPAQQAAVMAQASQDCFNWGYDPWHYSAPEGSYASDAQRGERRIREFRQ